MSIKSTTPKKKDHTYQGNPFIKRAGVEIEYTKDEIQDFIRCMEDPIYFATNYIKIVNVDEGLILWPPYDYQLRIFKECIDNRFVICKLPRQSRKNNNCCLFNFMDDQFQ